MSVSGQKNNKAQPHDAFFKQAMSHPKVAREFFETHLPQHIADQFDLNTLKQEKESFADKDFGSGVVDVLFSVDLKNNHANRDANEQKSYISILVEQQSRNDPWMSFRLYKYMLRICDHHLKKNKKSKTLPVIFPLIFYTGPEKYTAPLSFFDLFSDSLLAKKSFAEPFQLIDLHRIEDEDLKRKLWSGVMEYVMKKIYDMDILPALKAIGPILQTLNKENRIYIEEIFIYTVYKADTEKVEEVIEFLNETFQDKTEGEMTIAERLIERGIEQGMERGIEKGIEQGMERGIEQGMERGIEKVAKNLLLQGISVEDIAIATGLSKHKILELQDHNKITH